MKPSAQSGTQGPGTLVGTRLSLETLPALRQHFRDQIASSPSVERPGVVVTEVMVSSRAALPIRVVLSRPAGQEADLPALIHMHGGGYVAGSPEMNDARNRALAEVLPAAILSVDYRLAPETRFPGQVEDCFDVLQWLHGNSRQLGINPSRIGVIGESAGGGLAAALCLLGRDRGLPPLVCQHLINPMLDDRTCNQDGPHPLASQFSWDEESNRFAWGALLGTAPGRDGISPYAAPSRAPGLGGLPPCFIAVGALDLFLNENVAFGQRLERAGVPVEMRIYPDAAHGFFSGDTRVGHQARADSLASLRRAYDPSPRTATAQTAKP